MPTPVLNRLREERINSLLERRYRVAQVFAQVGRDHRFHMQQAALTGARRDTLAHELAEIDARLAVLSAESGEG